MATPPAASLSMPKPQGGGGHRDMLKQGWAPGWDTGFSWCPATTGHVSPILHPGEDRDTPEGLQDGGRAGSRQQPEISPFRSFPGINLAGGCQDQCRGEWQPQEQPGRAGWAPRDLVPAPFLSASHIYYDFFKQDTSASLITLYPTDFSILRLHRKPDPVPAPAWLQLKFPSNGG